MTNIKQEYYGTLPDGRKVSQYTMSNGQGICVKLIDYGATVTAIEVPDRHGIAEDVTLGFDRLEDWVKLNKPYFGATIGRCANRIAFARFSLEGKEYQLAANNGPHSLHGGEFGFDKRLWKGEVAPDEIGPAVKFTYRSPDGEENYPGNLDVEVIYTLTDNGSLILTYAAETDQTTLVNLTHHSYFNLAGQGHGTILDHELFIAADTYNPVDETLIPTGENAPVEGTPFDFRKTRKIGQHAQAIGGYDHNFVLSGDALKTPAACIFEENSGRKMELFTSEPCFQLYTGSQLDGVPGKGGVIYGPYAGFCMEPQREPDAIHHDHFHPVVLHPGELYKQVTTYRFGVI